MPVHFIGRIELCLKLHDLKYVRGEIGSYIRRSKRLHKLVGDDKIADDEEVFQFINGLDDLLAERFNWTIKDEHTFEDVARNSRWMEVTLVRTLKDYLPASNYVCPHRGR
ncbi:hypothetical protein HDV00_005822 [Rhizophlyctis rosea]|nr:hypothetical protein HDV00_005822 [Rhizophlyctis rosea]